MARTPGAVNKLSATVKENIITVFDRVGGLDKMAEWAKENLGEFYKFYAKLLPTVIDGRIDVEHRMPSYAELIKSQGIQPQGPPADSVVDTVQ